MPRALAIRDPQAPSSVPLSEGFRLAVRPHPFGGGDELEWLLLKDGAVIDSGEAFDGPDARRQALEVLRRQRAYRTATSQRRRMSSPSFNVRGLAVGRDLRNRELVPNARDPQRKRKATPKTPRQAIERELEAHSAATNETAPWTIWSYAVELSAIHRGADPDIIRRHPRIRYVLQRAYDAGEPVWMAADEVLLIARAAATPSTSASASTREHLRGALLANERARRGRDLGTLDALPPESERFVFQHPREADIFEYRMRAMARRPRRIEPGLVRVRAPAAETRQALEWARAYGPERDEDEDDDRTPRRALKSRTGLGDREIDRLRASGLLKDPRWARDPQASEGRRLVGEFPSERATTFQRAAAATAYAQILREHGFSVRLGKSPLQVIAWIPPLTAREQREFDVRDEDGLVKKLSDQAVRATLLDFVATRPGDPKQYPFRAPSLEFAREHARKHLGPTATAEAAQRSPPPRQRDRGRNG